METKTTLESLIQSKLDSGDIELPIFDEVALRIDREVRENKLDADLLCQILEEDLALVAELLRTANSAFFSSMSPVGSLKEAAVRLGVRQIASIVFSVSQKRLYSASGGMFKGRLTRLWKHTSAVSLSARWLANNSGFRGLSDEVFVAGLLHDIGKLSLLCLIETLIEKEALDISAEEINATLERMNCEHGVALLDLWNMPDSFKVIISELESEVLNKDNTVLCIIRLCDAACLVEGLYDMPTSKKVDLYSMPEVQALALTEADVDELCSVLRETVGGKKKAA